MKKLNHKNITETAEWHFMLSKINDIETSYVDDMVLAAKDGDVAKVQFLGGQIQQLRVFKTMPQDWMPEQKE